VSENAIRLTTIALQTRLESVLGKGTVLVSAPKNVLSSFKASLFLFNVVPNRDLRNSEHFVLPPTPPSAPGPSAPQSAARPVDALPVDLRYLITVRAGDPTPDLDALETLGQIMRILHIEPTLSGGILEGQQVRLTPEPYSVEEFNRIWGMFPDEVYSPSVVYLASPVFIYADLTLGPPVLERRLKQGVSADPTGGARQQGFAA
jgi:hypothetical protein